MATNLPSSLHHLPLSHRHHHHHPTTRRTTTTPLTLSFSPRPRRCRRTIRRLKKNHSFHFTTSSSTYPTKLQFILDVDELKTRTPLPLQRTLDYCQSNFHQFVSSSIEAYNDLRTVVVVEPGTSRVVVACSQSTVRFVGGLVVWSCVGFVLVRVLAKLGLGFKRRSEGGVKVEVVTRRDRSLGGREVVVEKKVGKGGERKSDVIDRDFKAMPRSLRREQRKLPSWWLVIGPRMVLEDNRDEYRRQASQLVQGWLDFS